MFRFGRKKYIKRTPERVRLYVNILTDEIIKCSEGNISYETAENMAYRCVSMLDFNNSAQMHRNLSDYAAGIVCNYNNKSQKEI